MINTYLNDNQAMPYPFYGYGSLPFPMCVITGIGLCIHIKEPEALPTGFNTIYANSIAISENSVTVALCRKPSTRGVELVGVLYATLDGGSTYIPSYDNTVVTNNPDADQLQTFYTQLNNNVDTRATAKSTGFLQLGSIPSSAIGNYSGEFYLDPACVTYVTDAVYGRYSKYSIGANTYDIDQRFDIDLSGLLLWKDRQITTKYLANENAFVVLDDLYKKRVDKINGTSIEGTYPYPYPVLILKGHTVSSVEENTTYVELEANLTATNTVVVTVNGTDVFPNCYKD